jgi:hypothetical protein
LGGCQNSTWRNHWWWQNWGCLCHGLVEHCRCDGIWIRTRQNRCGKYSRQKVLSTPIDRGQPISYRVQPSNPCERWRTRLWGTICWRIPVGQQMVLQYPTEIKTMVRLQQVLATNIKMNPVTVPDNLLPRSGGVDGHS